MSSEERDPERRDNKWVRIERESGRSGRAAKGTVHISVPGEKADRTLAEARRELVRVERKFLKSMARSRELPEFAKHEVQIRLRELERADEG